MEIHLHLSAAYSRTAWVEHFECLEPMFNERLQIKDGHMIVPSRPGPGLSLSAQTTTWTADTTEIHHAPDSRHP
jgi:L-alanine-DL-glutamate epimerase-like enolase superfamily enzyme